MQGLFLVFIRSSFTQIYINTTVAATRIPPVCPKCAAIKKSGKLSCCAPGGTWFQNCGTSRNSDVDHTWVEGVQACKHVVSLFLGMSKSQITLINQTTNTQPLNDVEQKTIGSSLTSTFVSMYYDTPAGSCKNNDYVSNNVVFISILFIVCFNIQS